MAVKRKTMYPNFLGLRLSDTELERLENMKKESGLKSYSAVIRKLLDGDGNNQIRSKAEYLDLKKLVYEVNKIGGNINQLARLANEHMFLDGSQKKMLLEMQERLIKLVEILFYQIIDPHNFYQLFRILRYIYTSCYKGFSSVVSCSRRY